MGGVVAKLAFLPPPPTYKQDWAVLRWLTTSRESRIPFVFIDFPGSRTTILFSHANAEDLGLIYDHVVMLSDVLQVNVMAYDYTGYGHASGTPSEQDCYADIAACFAFLLKEKDLLPSEIILFGRSLGSGPSVELASRAQVGRTVRFFTPLAGRWRYSAERLHVMYPSGLRRQAHRIRFIFKHPQNSENCSSGAAHSRHTRRYRAN